MNVNKNLKFGLGRVQNIVRRGENAGYQHFLLFPQCFQKASFQGSLKVRIKVLCIKVVKTQDCVVKSYDFFQDPTPKAAKPNSQTLCNQRGSRSDCKECTV